jgi:DNA-binding CsgD family transcriptional regulator
MEQDNIREELTAVRIEIARLEGRVMALERVCGGADLAPPLPTLTTKQHAALQMLLRGASNAEIAERFGVTVNTAKVYVRSLFAKFGVHNRASVVVVAKARFDATNPEEYMRWSGGLPKTWDNQRRKDDPYAPLYRYGGDDGTETEEG